MDSSVILSITGWTTSKASGDADGGVSALEGWLKNKAKRPIQSSQVNGDVLQIEVAGKDKRSFLHVDGWRWAGVDVRITDGQPEPAPRNSRSSVPSGPRGGGFNQTQPRGGGFNNQSQRFNQNQPQNGELSSRITGGPTNGFGHQRNQNQNQNQIQNRELFSNPPSGPRGGGFQQNRQTNGNASSPFGQNSFGQNKGQQQSQADPVRNKLIELVRKRYNANEKFLDLSALAADPLIQEAALNTSPADKVFRALFVVIEEHVFETREKRAEMIESVSFKNNSLSTVKEILGASSTFYKIKNLDLSHNNITRIGDLAFWKNRFPGLERIILAGNPVDGPQTRDEVKKWYKGLQSYNLLPLDAPLTNGLETQPPVPSPSPIPGAGPNGQILTPAGHPEFPDNSTFGLPLPGKPEDQIIKEQMGLKFSYETRLKMKWVEECLVTNNFDYDKALNDLNIAMSSGNVPADAFIQ